MLTVYTVNSYNIINYPKRILPKYSEYNTLKKQKKGIHLKQNASYSLKRYCLIKVTDKLLLLDNSFYNYTIFSYLLIE